MRFPNQQLLLTREGAKIRVDLAPCTVKEYPPLQGRFHIEEWIVEPQLNNLTHGDQTLHIEPKAMQVLVCLAEHAGEVVAKERLIRAVWADTFVGDDVLTRTISDLRKAFE